MIPLPQRTRSLRSYLNLGLVGLFGGVTAGGLLLHFQVLGQTRAHAQEQIRALSRNQAQQALMQALLDQEVSLRGYLATGDLNFLESFGGGGKALDDLLQVARANLNPEDLALVRERLDQLSLQVTAWHQSIALPLIRARRQGPLTDLKGALLREKQAYEGIRNSSLALVRELDERDNQRLIRLEQDLETTRWITMLALGAAAAGAYAFSRWLLRRLANPLRDLADQARDGDGFAEPDPHAIREVDILSHALYDLDRRVREREAILRRDQEEAKGLQAYTELVQQLATEEELLEAFTRALGRILGVSSVRIFLRPEQGDGLLFGLEAPTPEDCESHRILRSANACRALRQGSFVGLEATAPTACFCELGVPDGGSYLCLPLVASGQALGVVNLQGGKGGSWVESGRRTAEALAQVTAAALLAQRSLKQARDQAVRDGLTGVFNRRFLDEVFPKLADQARRREEPLSVLMLDIDHFKRFNDQFGHEVGDRVLKLFARTLQSRLRNGDVLARYGGEEFVVLLPRTSLEDARTLAERLRQTFEALEPPEPEFPAGCRITASIGISASTGQGLEREGLLQAADQALYVAKGTGRNRVVDAESLARGLEAP